MGVNSRRSALHDRPSRGGRPALLAVVAAALVAAAVGLAGCTPGPAPTPLFTSEADAFKAAEQVFRDYIESVNAENGNPSADSQKFLAGKALEDDIASVRDMQSSGKKIVGVTTVSGYKSESYVTESRTVASFACLDVSATRIVDANGNDITPKGRPPVVAVDVSMVLMSDEFKIVGMTASKESCS